MDFLSLIKSLIFSWHFQEQKFHSFEKQMIPLLESLIMRKIFILLSINFCKNEKVLYWLILKNKEHNIQH